jgi:nucleotide-binding universal stress UspA family protein
MYDDVLVPTDGSVSMEAVVDHVEKVAAEHDATVHGLYVVDTASFSDVPIDTSFEGVAEQLREEGERALEDLADAVGDAPVRQVIREGSPASEIVDYAEEAECDVVVMGTHGRTGVDRLVMGSVAERVVRSSPVPVTTVRV